LLSIKTQRFQETGLMFMNLNVEDVDLLWYLKIWCINDVLQWLWHKPSMHLSFWASLKDVLCH